jgi:hypothetical protein
MRLSLALKWGQHRTEPFFHHGLTVKIASINKLKNNGDNVPSVTLSALGYFRSTSPIWDNLRILPESLSTFHEIQDSIRLQNSKSRGRWTCRALGQSRKTW